MKNLLSWGVIALLGWVGYTSLFGNSEDKALRDELFKGVKQTTQTVKYRAGQYNDELEAISRLVSTLRTKSSTSGVDYSAELEDLENKKARLERTIEQVEAHQAAPAKTAETTLATRKKGALSSKAKERLGRKAAQADAPSAETPAYTGPTDADIQQDFKALQSTLSKLEQKLEN
jgi:hypothetical protein